MVMPRDELDPETRAAIEGMYGTPPAGTAPPPKPAGGSPAGSFDPDELSAILAYIDTLEIPTTLKIRYKQAWINYAQASSANDATAPEGRAFMGTAKAVSDAFSILNSVDDDVKTYIKGTGGRTEPQEDLARAQADYYRAQAAKVGAPTPDKPGEYELRMANIAKIRQSLQNSGALAFKQIDDYIDELARDPSISQSERDKRLELMKANVMAGLEGTTPFEKSKYQKESEERQRTTQTNLAADVMKGRASIGSNLAQGLLSGITGGFGKIYAQTKPRYDYNIYDMANSYLDTAYGGQEMDDLAKSILMGALGRQS